MHWLPDDDYIKYDDNNDYHDARKDNSGNGNNNDHDVNDCGDDDSNDSYSNNNKNNNNKNDNDDDRDNDDDQISQTTLMNECPNFSTHLHGGFLLLNLR